LCRNTILAICALSLTLPSPASPQSLRELADRAGILVGTAVRPSQFSEAAYAATLGHEFNMLEPEDAMKWWVIRPDPGTFDFTQGDRIVAFAETHRMKVRGHTLVWGWSNPAWLLEGHFTSAQLSTRLQEHIQTVLTHYRGHVFAWDVVNEAFEEPGNLKDSVWYNRPASVSPEREPRTWNKSSSGHMPPIPPPCSSTTTPRAKP
jgi:endo-1,4-beta-xylanase